MSTNAEAVETLMQLGLTEYEARCYVALTQLSDGTAKEISQVADVPQSRVYDVADQLHEQGLVDVQESDPRRYIALPVEDALRRLSREYKEYIERANQQLDELETRDSDGDGVWEIANREDVVVRLIMHIGNADDEVFLAIGDDDLLERELVDGLSEAADEGLDVRVEVPSTSMRERLHDVNPALRVAVSELRLEDVHEDDRSPGRLLMTDGETILMSASMEGLVPGEREETGLWGSEVGHGLVVWLRPLLEAHMAQVTFETGGAA